MSSSVMTVDGQESRTAESDFDAVQRRLARRVRLRRITRGVVGLLFLLAVWQVVSMVYDLTVVLPTPSTVITGLFRMLTLQENPWPYQGGRIYSHVGASLVRALIGFVLGVAAAIPIGLVIGKYTPTREFFAPALSALYPIPGSAWIPLAFLWFGLNNTSVIFVVFISAFFPMYFNTEAGVRAISPLLVDAGRCFGARGFGLMRRVVFPASAPFVISGLRIAIGSSWRVLVVAEMLVGSNGVGYMLTQSQFFFRSDDLLSVMIVIGVIGYVTEKLIVGTIERRTIARWER